jgi:hypothetical protein
MMHTVYIQSKKQFFVKVLTTLNVEDALLSADDMLLHWTC